jgi:hypothetical protein
MQKLMPHITKHLRRIKGLILPQFAFKEFSAVRKETRLPPEHESQH